ncbi:MAG: hypothetical protein UZ22_OP11002000306 [Microgenomates bacterium OLB23]|nr:MAG: hypothetical protein UZ22_OP11002000306 [Microgenomates bacterium OLB23]
MQNLLGYILLTVIVATVSSAWILFGAACAVLALFGCLLVVKLSVILWNVIVVVATWVFNLAILTGFCMLVAYVVLSVIA